MSPGGGVSVRDPLVSPWAMTTGGPFHPTDLKTEYVLPARVGHDSWIEPPGPGTASTRVGVTVGSDSNVSDASSLRMEPSPLLMRTV